MTLNHGERKASRSAQPFKDHIAEALHGKGGVTQHFKKIKKKKEQKPHVVMYANNKEDYSSQRGFINIIKESNDTLGIPPMQSIDQFLTIF